MCSSACCWCLKKVIAFKLHPCLTPLHCNCDSLGACWHRFQGSVSSESVIGWYWCRECLCFVFFPHLNVLPQVQPMKTSPFSLSPTPTGTKVSQFRHVLCECVCVCVSDRSQLITSHKYCKYWLSAASIPYTCGKSNLYVSDENYCIYITINPFLKTPFL